MTTSNILISGKYGIGLESKVLSMNLGAGINAITFMILKSNPTLKSYIFDPTLESYIFDLILYSSLAVNHRIR